MFSALPDSVAAKIYNKIAKDLAPSAAHVHFKLCLAVLFGGFVSLAICAQFGMGMTDLAGVTSHHLHKHMSPFLCAGICGTVFAIFPTLLLRLALCSPMQFRAILHRKFLALSLWYGIAGLVLANFGEHGLGLKELLFWLFSAVLTCYLFAAILKLVLPTWRLPWNYYE